MKVFFYGFILVCLSTSAMANKDYAQAAKAYVGTTIKIVDERTDAQENLKKIIPLFTKETGINVDYSIIGHFELLDYWKSARSEGDVNDAVTIHSAQMGYLLKNNMLTPIDDMINNEKLSIDNFNKSGLIQDVWNMSAKHNGQTYGFVNWVYNNVLMSRGDLINHAEEKSAFEKRYGYPLAIAENYDQLYDIAEFFTRKKGELLAGEVLKRDFYGITMNGLGGVYMAYNFTNNFIRNWGGDIFDESGRPSINSSINTKAAEYWYSLWQFSPPQQGKYSIIEIPQVMGGGIAAQSILFSDFIYNVDDPKRSRYHGKFIYATTPKNKGNQFRVASIEPSFLVIDKRSKNAEATFLFLQWIADFRTQSLISDDTKGKIIPNREAMWGIKSMKESRYSNLHQAMKTSIQNGQNFKSSEYLMEILTIIGTQLHEIGVGNVSAKEGLDVAQKKALAICEECFLK